MGRFDSAKRMLHAKAVEVLGEDTVENLKELKDDAVKAGGQVKSVAKEVWDDCDNEVLENARDFYTEAARKTQKGVSNSIKAAQDSAEARRHAREEARQRREEERRRRKEARKKLLKRVFPILICMIIAVVLIFSAAIWLGQKSGGQQMPEMQTNIETHNAIDLPESEEAADEVSLR